MMWIAYTKRIVELEQERGELLAALNDVKDNAGNSDRVYEIAETIITKVEGVK